MITMPDINAITVSSCQQNPHKMDAPTQDAVQRLAGAARQYFHDQLVIAALCSPWGRFRA